VWPLCRREGIRYLVIETPVGTMIVAKHSVHWRSRFTIVEIRYGVVDKRGGAFVNGLTETQALRRRRAERVVDFQSLSKRVLIWERN